MALAGRHAVVTGGGSGVGAAIAGALAQAGASVSILGRREGPLAEVAARTGATAIPCDAADPAALAAALDRARAAHGPVAIAVANAGAADSAPFAKMTAEGWREAMAVNLDGVFHLFRACLPEMTQARWGRLIAVASTAGLKGYGYVAAYCAAKHGAVGLVRALAQEVGPTGVTVNALCPGFVETPMLARSVANIVAKTGKSEDEAAAALRSVNPQRRFVQADEVADAAVWLCSEGARSVNGHALSVSGGEV